MGLSSKENMLNTYRKKFLLVNFLGLILWGELLLLGSLFLREAKASLVFFALYLCGAAAALWIQLRKNSFLSYCHLIERKFPFLGLALSTYLTFPAEHPMEKIHRQRLQREIDQKLKKLPFSLVPLFPFFTFLTHGLTLWLAGALFFFLRPSRLPSNAETFQASDVEVQVFPQAYTKIKPMVLSSGKVSLPEGSRIVIHKAGSLPVQVQGLSSQPFFLRRDHAFELWKPVSFQVHSARQTRRFVLEVIKDSTPRLALSEDAQFFMPGHPVSLSIFAQDDYGLQSILFQFPGGKKIFQPEGKSFSNALTFLPPSHPFQVTIKAKDNCPFREQWVVKKVLFKPLHQEKPKQIQYPETTSNPFSEFTSHSTSEYLAVSDTASFVKEMEQLLKQPILPTLESRKSNQSILHLLPYLPAKAKDTARKIFRDLARWKLPESFQKDFLWKREEWERDWQRQQEIAREWHELLKLQHQFSLTEELVRKEERLVKHFQEMERKKLSPFVQKGMLSYHLYEQRKAEKILKELLFTHPELLQEVKKVSQQLQKTKASLQAEDVTMSWQNTEELLKRAKQLKSEAEARLAQALKRKKETWGKRWLELSEAIIDLSSNQRALMQKLHQTSHFDKLQQQQMAARQHQITQQGEEIARSLQSLMMKTFRWDPTAIGKAGQLQNLSHQAERMLKMGNKASAAELQSKTYSTANLLGLDVFRMDAQIKGETPEEFARRAGQFLEKMWQQQWQALRLAMQSGTFPESWQWWLYAQMQNQLREQNLEKIRQFVEKWSRKGTQQAAKKKKGQKKSPLQALKPDKTIRLFRKFLRLYYALKTQGLEKKRESQPGKPFVPLKPRRLKLKASPKKRPPSSLTTKHRKALESYFRYLSTLEKRGSLP